MYTVVFHPQPRLTPCFRDLRPKWGRRNVTSCIIKAEKKLIQARQRRLGKRMCEDIEGEDPRGFRLHKGWCD